jgi:hypothetical protein
MPASFIDKRVEAVFAAYPPSVNPQMLAIREVLFRTAALTPAVGQIEETLKWGEPAYLTPETNSGSTIRMDWKQAKPEYIGLYFNCKTNLVDGFRAMFPDEFQFEGNRALMVRVDEPLPIDPIAYCFRAALTYHLNKR